MKKKIFAGIVSLFVCFSFCLLIGCSSSVQKSSIHFGTKTETTKTLTLTNNTGQDITAVNVQLVGDASSKELYATDNEIWKNDAIAEIFLENASGSTVNTENGDLQLRACYHITLLLNDGTSVTLHNLTQAGVEDYKDAKLCINADDKLAFIEYTDPTGNVVNTLASEQKVLADQKAAAEAERAKQNTSKNGSGGYAGSSSRGQSTDDCTGGNIKLR